MKLVCRRNRPGEFSDHVQSLCPLTVATDFGDSLPGIRAVKIDTAVDKAPVVTVEFIIGPDFVIDFDV